MSGQSNGNTNGARKSTGPALCDVDEFVSKKYDYVIVGGGTAGLCVAARLSENKDVTVGVIEVGENRMDDPAVSTPSMYPTLIGRKEYDFCMESVPQPTAGNKTYSMPRGKVLGGSSAINYLMYVRGSKNDYNAWESMGNKGWGWDDLLPYFKKHQTLDPPNKKAADPQFMPNEAKDKYHGSNGPIHTSFNDWYMPLEEDFCTACYEVGDLKKTLHDAWSGDHMGFYSSLAAVSREPGYEGTRSYAATGYLRPNLGRPNLRVLVEAKASRIILKNGEAQGVEFAHGGKKYEVLANKEVVLSTGTIHTPQLLELSGIGDPEVLKKAGVECLVENKGVGHNFQDHVLGGMLFDCAPGIISMDELNNGEFAKAQQEIYDKDGQGVFGSPGMLMGFISYAQVATKEELDETLQEVKKNSRAETPFEKKQEEAIAKQLTDPNFANIQTFCIPCQLDLSAGADQTKFFSSPPNGKNRVSLLVCLEHPFSRGTVHISSSDPDKAPTIDPGYFRNPVDVTMLAAGIKWMEQVSNHPLVKKSLGERVQPPPDYDLSSEEARKQYVRDHISTQYHIIGTAAMGDVVDDTLKVKGAKKLRIVDASVFPCHVSGNIMASTYAVAEKGADLVKADDGRF